MKLKPFFQSLLYTREGGGGDKIFVLKLWREKYVSKFSNMQPVSDSLVCNDEKWPVIIHCSLQNTDIFTILNGTHKVRGIYIFFAFMIVRGLIFGATG